MAEHKELVRAVLVLALAATLLEVLREQNPRPAAETAGS